MVSVIYLFIFFNCHLSLFISPLPANRTAGGAVAEKSLLFSVFISHDASHQTAAGTANVWTESVAVIRAGRVSPVTLFSVNPPPADLMASALRVGVEVKFKENQTTDWFIFLVYTPKTPSSKIKNINLGLMKRRSAKSTLYCIQYTVLWKWHLTVSQETQLIKSLWKFTPENLWKSLQLSPCLVCIWIMWFHF